MLKDKLKSLKITNQYWIKELTSDEYKELLFLTSFLNDDVKLSIRRIYIINDIIEVVKCPVCGEEITKIDSTTQKLKVFCSNKCKKSETGRKIISEKSKKTCIEKYGTDYYKEMGKRNTNVSEETKEKRKQTINDRYGVDNIFQDEETKKRIIENNNKKYGTDYYTQTEESKKKYIHTCLELYNVENISQLPEVKNKITRTRRKNYWNEFLLLLDNKKIKPLFDIDTYIASNIGDTLHFHCLRCNKDFNFDIIESQGIEVKVISCHNHTKQSLGELEVSDWLSSKNVKIINNKRFTINGTTMELDLYLPDYNIGIEYHGLYWHSELHRNKNYHFDKHIFFKNQNIEVIQIFESEWVNKQDIVKSIILNRLSLLTRKVFGRHCTIRNLQKDEYRMFLESNHLQGYANANVKIGLFKNDELLQVMSFSKPRFNSQFDWENIRTATKINTVVLGGFSKLLKNFTSEYSGSIISYVDLRYFTGTGYVKNEFVLNGISKPNFFYFKTNSLSLYNRMKYQKHKLKKLLTTFDANLTEHENMLNNGYLRIYDAGNLILVIDKY